MKKIFYLGLLFSTIILFPKCLDNGSYIRTDVQLNITNYYIPDTSAINIPCSISINTKSVNSCVDRLRFIISKSDEKLYNFFAVGTFENSGEECYELERTADSTYILTPTLLGIYYFQFFSADSLRPVLDSLVVIN